jgi:3-oxoacyl-(acyl-carrier-protein) synthase
MSASIVMTGGGHIVLEPGAGAETADSSAYLRAKKMRKFMGLQDEMAVIAAARALRSAGLDSADLGERAGLYLVVGHIPFEEKGIDELLEGAVVDGHFSMAAFTTQSYAAVSPLATFRCLPNMPAFHVSLSFDIQGPYFVTFPGAGQVYATLEEACQALALGLVDVALWGAVAHQRNYLVQQHYRRLERPPEEGKLRDAAGVIVLERAERARARGATVLAELEGCEVAYVNHDPWEVEPLAAEPVAPPGELGAASLPVLLSQRFAAGERAQAASTMVHRLQSRDGVQASSTWRGVA